MSRRGGFTLVEILVAAVVLEVGLLAVLGTSLLARRTLTRADVVERGVAQVERAYDSLTLGWTPGAGRHPADPGWVTWDVAASGRVRIRFGEGGDTALVEVEGILPAGTRGR